MKLTPKEEFRLGEILVQDVGLDPVSLDEALAYDKSKDEHIGDVLLKTGVIDAVSLIKALAIQFDIPYLDHFPNTDDIDLSLIQNVPINFAKEHKIFPLFSSEEGRVCVVISDPLNIDALDDIRVLLDAPIDAMLSSEKQILELINKVYGRIHKGADLEQSDKEEEYENAEELIDILDLTDEAPIIRWVNSIMFQAVKERASDIHIEPSERNITVRYRIDGRLNETKHANRQYLSSIVARIKIMAGLNIAEKRLPQDGRIRRRIAGKDVDMRVATAPTASGERITIRLLDKSAVLLGLSEIGMTDNILEDIRNLIAQPHGIFLVTGPTGSGKTTTLYACLSEINSMDRNILTIEDPVEYQLEGISQTQVNSKIDLTFANGMRSFLRHDPDIIMVGEIRDKETAEIAITASLTGHFVYSTVHTNDAPSAITRLIDMGTEPFLVASSLTGVLAQRLVRTPCFKCATFVRPTDNVLKQLGLSPERFFDNGYDLSKVKGQPDMPEGTVVQANGCKDCSNLGYVGRIGIYEFFTMNNDIRAVTLEKQDASNIRTVAEKHGMKSLRFDGARKAILGLTTPQEILLATADVVE